MSVRSCAKAMFTKTQERVKIIECGIFCLKSVYWESKLPNARRLTKLEPNEILNGFAISREPFDAIDSNFFYFEAMDYKTPPDLTGPHRMIFQVGAE